LDSKGVEYRCSVEISPFQKIPRERGSKDTRINTITTDPYYTEFLKEREKPVEMLASAEIQLEKQEAELKEAKAKGDPSATPQKQTTPLIEYLREMKAKQNSGDWTEVRKRRRDENRRERRVRKEKKEKKRKDRDKPRENESHEKPKDTGASSPAPAEKSIKILSRPKEETPQSNTISSNSSTSTSTLTSNSGSSHRSDRGDRNDRNKGYTGNRSGRGRGEYYRN